MWSEARPNCLSCMKRGRAPALAVIAVRDSTSCLSLDNPRLHLDLLPSFPLHTHTNKQLTLSPWLSAQSSSPGKHPFARNIPTPTIQHTVHCQCAIRDRLAQSPQNYCHTRPLTPLLLPSGTGYIGSFTALALLEADYKVVIVDNLYNSSEEVLNRIELICGKRPEYYSLDITDEKALDKVFEEHPDIDNVIHFAALKVSSAIARGRRQSGIWDKQRLGVWLANHLTNFPKGRRRVWRDPPRVLPRQRLRLPLPLAQHGQAQRHQHRLLFLRNCLR